MTLTEAKQHVAQKRGFSDFKEACYSVDNKINIWNENVDGFISSFDLLTEAAELWQQTNLDRIKELEKAIHPLLAMMGEKGFKHYGLNNLDEAINKAKDILNKTK